ncbi:S8 family peptidase [Pseudonocardia tropica]|uniref:S8 family peptidase n=1 Tax=Pseudonocardia tropica TaxID=681289 RepID=A0ABV1K2M7_9PSEU
MRQKAVTVLDEFKRRPPTLGVNPDLVLVLQTNRKVALEDLDKAGLSTLEVLGDRTLVAFSEDAALTKFLAQNAAYASGSPGLTKGGFEKKAAYQDLFDALEDIRLLEPADVLTDRARKAIELNAPSSAVRFDIQCWCSDDRDEAQRRQRETRSAIEAAGGVVLDSFLRPSVGASIICADVPAGRILALADVDRVRRIDTIPVPDLTVVEFVQAQPGSLPQVQPPDDEAPVVAVVDSGVRSGHPLLAPAIIGVEYLGAGLGDGSDESGHGTLVASLALFGSLEERISSGRELVPAGRLLSIRVLDDKNGFPDGATWYRTLLDALNLAVEGGAIVINLSLGDLRNPYSGPRPTSLGALVDEFARDNNVVIVVSAGNYSTIEWFGEELSNGTYPERILAETDGGILDPAASALALTVGALCVDERQGVEPARIRASIVPVGAEGSPSPYTRIGPGVGGAIKPELCAPGGSIAFDTELNRPARGDLRVQVVGAGGERPERLLATGAGTSFAAPLVSHAVLRAMQAYPSLNANSARALVLLSAGAVTPIFGDERVSEFETLRRFTGFGRVSAERAEASTDHRAVLLAETSIDVDGVQVYKVRLPQTFFESGGQSRITIALTYDPLVRPTRLDYMSSRMSVFGFFGVSHEEVALQFAKLAKAEKESSVDEAGENERFPTW